MTDFGMCFDLTKNKVKNYQVHMPYDGFRRGGAPIALAPGPPHIKPSRTFEARCMVFTLQLNPWCDVGVSLRAAFEQPHANHTDAKPFAFSQYLLRDITLPIRMVE